MQYFTRKQFWLLGLIALLCVSAGFVVGYYSHITPSNSYMGIREQDTSYKFIHPLLAINRIDMSIPAPVYVPLLNKIKDFIASQKKVGSLDSASVYFVNYGQKTGSFALNEKEAYAPASMLKVVVMVAYLKKADSDPSILGTNLTYNPNVAEELQSIPFESPSTLVFGRSYTVESLIRSMIIDSDNGAMNLLISNIDPNYLNMVYRNLGLQVPSDNSLYMISAEDYSLFLRVLYNGTYLSDKNSEKALSILSQATYYDGLVAGVPSGTVVAHKYGEHVVGSGDQVTSVELHDCGFVYPAKDPYLLCVMTRGKNLAGLTETISGISKLVYGSVVQ